MVSTPLQQTSATRVQTAAAAIARLFYLDHLRAALIILVVLHHTAVVYGASAPFYYSEPPLTDPLAFMVFLTFVLLNQAWFMGALFLIAGYFTPGSFDRKGTGSFVKSRLLRLGVPLLVFYFILAPISAIGFWQMPASMTGITTPLTLQDYPSLVGLGPAWFIALLLVFDFGYVAWRRLTRNRTPRTPDTSSAPGYLAIGVFVLALALTNYLTRIVIPMGRDVLGFPTLSYLPQYLTFFVIGGVAYRRNWLQNLPGSKGAVGLAAAIIATVLLFPLALSSNLFSLRLAQPLDFVGNGSRASAIYALWDSIFAVGIFLAALTFFRRFLNSDSRFGTFLSQQSYAVYLIHTPILVFLAVAVKGIGLQPFLKFGAVGALVLTICYVLAYLLRKIPGVARVI